MNRYFLLIFFAGAIISGCKEKRYKDAQTPEKELESFEYDPNFTVELFASEPVVTNPVEMVMDENSNVYVVEMPDYPYKPEDGKGMGSIKRLIDEDGDGKADKSTVFAEGLSEATSVLPYMGGLLVTAAPNIYFMKDTTGDFRADIKEVLFTGFFQNNSEAQITSLRYGLDNWIYASNNGQIGEITFTRKPNAPAIAVKGGDFRFRLDKGLFEVETGQAQFGQTFNDWNHRFVTQNTLYIQQAIIPWRYLHRHEYLPSSKGMKNIGDADGIMYQKTPAPYWRAERTSRRQKQYAEQKLDRKEYADGHFTGASGGTHYGGHSFPKEYFGNIFIGDVAGNLVHRAVLKSSQDSAFYKAGRADFEKGKEFLASTDPWFRPVNFYSAPDGNLYIMDMYHQHIETPVSIPDDLKEDMDFENGKKYGRIWRVVPKKGGIQKPKAERLSENTPSQLVELLAHPNQWYRLQAQRLLLERQDRSVVDMLKKMATNHADPRARLHALYTLEGLGSLEQSLVTQAMKDVNPGNREHGVLLAERYPAVLNELIKCTKDSSGKVRLQATLSLGQFTSEAASNALLDVLKQNVEDNWFRVAVLSSNAGSSFNLLQKLKNNNFFEGNLTLGKRKLLEDWAFIVASRNNKGEATQLLQFQKSPDIEFAVLKGFSKYLNQDNHKELTDDVLGTLKGLKVDKKSNEVLSEILAKLK